MITIFSASLLSGYVVNLFKNDYVKTLATLFLIFVGLLLNLSYFKPLKYINLNDKVFLQEETFTEYSKGAMLDYLYKEAIEPKVKADSIPNLIGDGRVYDYEINSGSFGLKADLKGQSNVIIPQYYFPGWKVWTDDKMVEIKKDPIGRIEIEVPSGEHQLVGRFSNTPIRTISDVLTGIGLLFVIILYSYEVRNKKLF